MTRITAQRLVDKRIQMITVITAVATVNTAAKTVKTVRTVRSDWIYKVTWTPLLSSL
jgi:hypothetical protein